MWLQAFQPDVIDRFLVCGKDYKAIRDTVGKALITCETEVIAAALKVTSSFLSSLALLGQQEGGLLSFGNKHKVQKDSKDPFISVSY